MTDGTNYWEYVYKTAETVSSNSDNERYSTAMMDRLLLNNGYTSRVLDNIKQRRKQKMKAQKRPSNNNQDGVILKLPYLNEAISRKYKDAVRQSGLPIKIVEKPGRKLKDPLTDSRPLDKTTCTTPNCRTCSALTEGNCTTNNTGVPDNLFSRRLPSELWRRDLQTT